mmetsp:Transcript_8284/g.23080  ORF Transcript_8284/g.23080 Transcript_8284/m.23080 type:complete len:171 (+) Transcript_8284:102-614(+)
MAAALVFGVLTCPRRVVTFQELLLSGGARPDDTDGDGRSALWLAAFRGRAQLVRALLDAGAAKDLRDAQGVTPLLVACAIGHYDCAALLLKRSADPSICDENRCSPLMISSQASAPYLSPNAMVGGEQQLNARQTPFAPVPVGAICEDSLAASSTKCATGPQALHTVTHD